MYDCVNYCSATSHLQVCLTCIRESSKYEWEEGRSGLSSWTFTFAKHLLLSIPLPKTYWAENAFKCVLIYLGSFPDSPPPLMNQVSLGSVMMMAETREQNGKESIKPTVAALTDFCRFILLGEWSRVLLPMTGVGLRWKSLKRQESVEAGAGWERSNVSRSSFPIALKSKLFFFVFCFPRSFSSPTLFHSLSPPYITSESAKSAHASSSSSSMLASSSSSSSSLSSLSSPFLVTLNSSFQI